ncbi:MAG: hypothetical protein F4Y04_05585 [Chloroflexi bacterium]|nr:hypothetical protein [Chloroflexota bacterium]
MTQPFLFTQVADAPETRCEVVSRHSLVVALLAYARGTDKPDGGVNSIGLVEPSMSWDAVPAQPEPLLGFEGESHRAGGAA